VRILEQNATVRFPAGARPKPIATFRATLDMTFETSHMRVTTLLLGAVFVAASATSSSAATAWFLDGKCKESYLKRGTPTDDLTQEAGDPISCKKLSVIALKNGRKIVQFVTGTGVLGFAGSEFDTTTNKAMLIIPIDRILPVRDLGTEATEIMRRSSQGEGVLDGAEGFCMFDSKRIEKAKQMTCISMHERGNKKVVYRMMMDIRKATKDANFPDL